VTDANLILGRTDPAWFAGGQMTLDVDAARRAARGLGDELGLDTIELAEGICDVINAKMAQAIRTLTVEKGIEPRDFALVAFGGAGPMHAAFLADELEVGEVIVPRFPGAFSAWGMLETEIRKDFAQAWFSPLADVDHRQLAAVAAELGRDADASLSDEGIAPGQGRIEHALDIRYVGQEYTLTVPLRSATEPNEPDFDEALAGRFDDAHARRFGHANPGAPIELVTLRTTALGDLGRAQPKPLERQSENAYAYDERAVVFGRAERNARVVRRDALSAGAVVDGPAVIVEDTATTVVPPRWRLRVDTYGDLIMTRDDQEE
jgi:N-methylhydantoinase A